MNASLRLVRWLALFFRSILFLFPYVLFSASPIIEIDVIQPDLIHKTIIADRPVALYAQNAQRATGAYTL
jgi:hypothetical protein